MTFKLRFPFELPVGREITGLDQAAVATWDKLNLELRLDRGSYVITLEGIESEQEGARLAQTLWSALSWIMLKRFFPFEATCELGKIMYAPDPEEAARNLGKAFNIEIVGPLHGSYNANEPIVYEAGLQLRGFAAGKPTVIGSLPAQAFLDELTDVLVHPRLSEVASDKRLVTALDIYRSHLVESSLTGRLLTLVMSIEALVEPRRKHELAVGFLDKWEGELNACLKERALSPEERDALTSVQRELLFRKSESIRQAFRRTVSEALSAVGDPEAGDLASRAAKVYDRRSKLIHEGSLDPQALISAQRDAFQIATRVLEALIKKIAVE